MVTLGRFELPTCGLGIRFKHCCKRQHTLVSHCIYPLLSFASINNINCTLAHMRARKYKRNDQLNNQSIISLFMKCVGGSTLRNRPRLCESRGRFRCSACALTALCSRVSAVAKSFRSTAVSAGDCYVALFQPSRRSVQPGGKFGVIVSDSCVDLLLSQVQRT